jgi:hypothetical protein
MLVSSQATSLDNHYLNMCEEDRAFEVILLLRNLPSKRAGLILSSDLYLISFLYLVCRHFLVLRHLQSA